MKAFRQLARLRAALGLGSHALEDGVRLDDLATLRARASRFFAGLLWLHVPVVIAIAISSHVAPGRVGSIMAFAAAVATLAAWRYPRSLLGQLTVAGAMTLAPALMVYAGQGAWQVDWHMYFFVVFGMLVAFVDWRPIALSAALTAGHHLFLDLLFPSGVFPEPGLERVALHAGIVLTECVVLFWVIAQMRRLIETSAINQERLIREVANHARAQKTAHLGSWERDLQAGSVMWSEEMYRICGLQCEGSSPPKEPGAFDHPEDASMVARALASARDKGDSYDVDHRVVRPDGVVRWIQEQGNFTYAADGTPTHMLGTAFDITERKEAEALLIHQASHDLLTGLPNRVLVYDRLMRALARARRDGSMVAVLFLNLDRFKAINDTLGRVTGDHFLQAVGARLCERVRPNDTVARIGGDEFAIVMPDLSQDGHAAEIAQDFVEACLRPYCVDGDELYASASIGVALSPLDGNSADALMRAAEAAMNKAKEDGGGSFHFYTAALQERVLARLALEKDLRHALERNEFVLYYQPIVANSGRIVGFEALLRWMHPEKGLIDPDQFIPLAEETGLIVAIGKWVLHTACAQAQTWHESTLQGIRVAVNISARQFLNRGLRNTIGAALDESGLNPSQLEVELTESMLMGDVQAAVETLRELKAMGVRISIDDFGTGYSSLAYLQRFPIDTLKIDKSFIRDIPGNGADSEIVKTVMALAHSLRLSVIAEGVETTEQHLYLRALECKELQGFYFKPPAAGAGYRGMDSRAPGSPRRDGACVARMRRAVPNDERISIPIR